MFTSGTTANRPVNCRLGIRQMTPGTRHNSISGMMYAWASLKLRAQLVIASSTAEKNAANSASSSSTLITTGSDKPAPPNSDTLSPVLCAVIAMPARFTSAVNSATASTATYFASNSPTRGTGAAISISSVPRSRSPAVRSIAG